MSLITCGSDEDGNYIELKKPKGETPPCFIDEYGVVHGSIKLYQWKAVRDYPVQGDRCVMCGEIIPEGSMVCSMCRAEVEKSE